ncbi:Multifunctional pyrimidine synthesis protein CAD [Halocaridina rubra]|uniref:Multifunctional pyrimidine synthesis protein CAD n=1 Tax=Halocaridina rubra TaxID=373956 RepID=A0AAN8WWJ6_HALRR
MWRYNRSPNNGSDCIGVDLNRNFDSHFGGVGSSNDPCTVMGIYHGPYAFSEDETQAIRDSLLSLNDRLTVYFAIHSYSQLWMTPYGYTFNLPPNYEKQKLA